MERDKLIKQLEGLDLLQTSMQGQGRDDYEYIDYDRLADFILEEIDKAREEGRIEYARELLDDYYQPDSDSITVDVSEIQSELSKLKQ